MGEARWGTRHDPRDPPPAAPEIERTGPRRAGPRGRQRGECSFPAAVLESATDADGTFSLSGVSPGKTVVLAEHAGFWLQGWLVDPSAEREVGPLVLARTTEGLGPTVKPQANPIPPEESRALADRLLAPYLPEEAEEADQEAKLAVIASVAEFDLDRALELFKKQRFANRVFSYLDAPFGLALKLAETDPARAEAMVESIRQIPSRADAYVRLAKALPVRERGSEAGPAGASHRPVRKRTQAGATRDASPPPLGAR